MSLGAGTSLKQQLRKVASKLDGVASVIFCNAILH
jgi:hypothetical protein